MARISLTRAIPCVKGGANREFCSAIMNVSITKGETWMADGMYPAATAELTKKRRELSGETETAFMAFSQKVFAEGALPVKIKQLIAVAVAHVTQCPYCIKGHTKSALPPWRIAAGIDGSNLGRCRNASRWRLCPFCSGA